MRTDKLCLQWVGRQQIEKGPPGVAGEPLVLGICGPVRRCAESVRPLAASLRREDRDGEVQQQRQAEAQKRQGNKADARPQDVDAELVCHPGAHAEDHPVATILAKTLFHFFPFHPGQLAGVIERGGWSGDQTVRANGSEEHHRAVKRSNCGNRVALERVDIEMGHDIFLP